MGSSSAEPGAAEDCHWLRGGSIQVSGRTFALAPSGEVPGNVRLHCGHDRLSCGAREFVEDSLARMDIDNRR